MTESGTTLVDCVECREKRTCPSAAESFVFLATLGARKRHLAMYHLCLEARSIKLILQLAEMIFEYQSDNTAIN
ncbi:hypothetical protein M0802_009751 [Mischocyttarus mexicanus]|nr:hypothetical protein M0802_009751 [Mischocyttarus mexicanus]